MPLARATNRWKFRVDGVASVYATSRGPTASGVYTTRTKVEKTAVPDERLALQAGYTEMKGRG